MKVPTICLVMVASLAVARGAITVDQLPKGSAPRALEYSHFPDRLHAFVWRNWELAPVERLAKVTKATAEQVKAVARSMGLPEQEKISPEIEARAYITIIRRNWHLLPYSQLLELLDWSPEKLAFTLREDDFLYVKLGNLKPSCEPLLYSEPTDETKRRAGEIGKIVRATFSDLKKREPLFDFVRQLSEDKGPVGQTNKSVFSPRFCYSYFALYGDPLLTPEIDPYPEGYLGQLAAAGVDGIWMQGVLENLSRAPWSDAKEDPIKTRQKNLGKLVARAKKHGISIYIYLNEPRAKPLAFYNEHPNLKGAIEGDHAALCTSAPEVRDYLRRAVAEICKAVPDLGGFFTITASENLSNCWSHQSGGTCPRCSKRSPAAVLAEVNNLFSMGIKDAGSNAKLIAWDWGWPDAWAEETINALFGETWFSSVSEWSLPINRGGIQTAVGEYSLSAIGPGPRAKRHWELARKHGLKTIAKIQAGNTWELSAVPYIPVLLNVAEHAENLRAAKVNGLMLGWTLGGYPSPNLEVVAEIGADPKIGAAEAVEKVARRRYGPAFGREVVAAWNKFSMSFREFPYDGGVVYNAPLQAGPSNLLWNKPTGYKATMVGIPYDDLDAWRGPYPPEIFIQQMEKVAHGFQEGITLLKMAAAKSETNQEFNKAFQKELSVAEAAQIHFASVASQSRFVLARRQWLLGNKAEAKAAMRKELELEKQRAISLYRLQSADSRLGFEATNHYYYVPNDLVEKVINCEQLLAELRD